MFRFKIGDSKISLVTDNPNQSAAPQLDDDKAASILAKLSGGYGAFGHTFNAERTSAIDLHYALVSNGYTVEILEGADQLQVYDPGIPEGAVT